MSGFLTGALGLFDSTVKAMLGEPVMAFFLVFLLVLTVTALFAALAAFSGRIHRR